MGIWFTYDFKSDYLHNAFLNVITMKKLNHTLHMKNIFIQYVSAILDFKCEQSEYAVSNTIKWLLTFVIIHIT